MPKDYSLTGETAHSAIECGTANPKWFRPDVDPLAIRELMQKSDAIALRDTLIWLGAMVLLAAIAIALWPAWWSAPFWLAYGVLYGSASDSRWHECGHKTAFRTPWMNNVVYHIASFMIMRNSAVWRASHIRHHTDTIVVGRDPEIVAMRPPDLARIALMFIGILDAYGALKRMFLHSSGRIHPDEATYVREADNTRIFLIARIWLVIYGSTIALAFWIGSILPLMLVGLLLFPVLAFQSLHLLGHLGLDAAALAAINLGFLDPLVQRLWCAADLRRD